MKISSPLIQRPYARQPLSQASCTDTGVPESSAPRDLCELTSTSRSDEVKKARKAAACYAISSLGLMTGLASIALAGPVAIPLVAYSVGAVGLVSGLLVDLNPFG